MYARVRPKILSFLSNVLFVVSKRPHVTESLHTLCNPKADRVFRSNQATHENLFSTSSKCSATFLYFTTVAVKSCQWKLTIREIPFSKSLLFNITLNLLILLLLLLLFISFKRHLVASASVSAQLINQLLAHLQPDITDFFRAGMYV